MRLWRIIVITIAITVIMVIALNLRVEKVEMEISKDWPMFRHDLANTGYTDVEGPNDNQILWKFKVEIFEVWVPPVVINGKVFVPEAGTSLGSYLYCLDAQNGELIWKRKMKQSPSVPTVIGNRIFIGGGWDNKIYALHAENGEMIWSYELPEEALGSPTVVDKKVLFPSYMGLYCLNADNGELIWKSEWPSWGYSVAVEGDHVFGGHPFCQLSLENGEVLWYLPTLGYTYHSIPAVAQGKVYVAGWKMEAPERRNRFYALDAETGEIIWGYDAYVIGAPAVGKGRIVIPAEDGIYCLSSENGELFWKFEDPFHFYLLIIANDKVYAGYRGGLCVLSLENGEMLWSYWGSKEEFWRMIVGGLAVAEGKLFVGSHSGHVLCFGS